MNGFYVFIYFCFFAIIAGGAFAMMWGNIKSINKIMDASIYKMMDEPVKKRHPEAPQPGEQVMYVDVSGMNSEEFRDKKQSLEDLFND